MLLDEYGLDVLETLGLNRDTSLAERAVLVYPGTDIHPYIDEINTLTLHVTGNTVASAVVTVDLFYGLDT